MFISKTAYVKYKECPRYLYLSIYKKDAIEISGLLKFEAKSGNEVGELAKNYFEDTVDASVVDNDLQVKCLKQVEKTKELLKENHNVIAEASFLVDDLFCAVDLLKKEEDDTYSIYEVKHAKDLDKKHYQDVAFQKYVCEKAGLNIKHIYILHPDENYIFEDKLDINKFLIPVLADNNKIVQKTLAEIDSDLLIIRKILKDNDPGVLYIKCGDCGAKKYCCENIIKMKDAITKLSGIGYSYARDYYKKGLFTIDYYEEPKGENRKENHLRNIQIDSYYRRVADPYIEKENIRKFLDSLKYPIYHLDFETTSKCVPIVNGFKPSESFPFQYSLDIEDENHNITHKEYLADKFDCTLEIANRLLEDIPKGATILAHSVGSAERSYLKYLGEKFPEYNERFQDMISNMHDLADPFKKGYYYNSLQNLGSSTLNSIKTIMPVLCPEHADDYNNLPGVHKGDEAKTIFLEMLEEKDPIEREKIRKEMLDYCHLDTMSMVYVLDALRKLVE